MTFKEFKWWADLHSDFIKDEDRDKLDNLLKMAYIAAHKEGFQEAKNKVIELFKKRK